MSSNVAWDSYSPPTLEIPYNRAAGELQDEPRFVRGQNTYITWGGKISRRPGTVELNANATLGLRVDRMWSYETLDTPVPVVYIVVSAFNPSSGLWEIWHQRQTNTPTPFVQSGTYRDLNLSTAPHEAVVQRGFLFIKSFPSSSSTEKLGTVIFDGTAGTVTIKPWGILGPTSPVLLESCVSAIITDSGGISATATTIHVQRTDNTSLSNPNFPATPFVIQIDFEQIQVTNDVPIGFADTFTVTRAFNGTVASSHNEGALVLYRGWDVSAHEVIVEQGWRYAYAWKDINGQYSNLSPPTSNPDDIPDNTTPFFNQIPQIRVQGHADTINIPSVGIFRTTDGGGTFFFLGDITNTGAGQINYIDDTLTSNTGNHDPVPDTLLNAATLAPSLTSNSPPPTVLAPAVTGVATPTQSTPIASYQGRLWFGIGNVLFFSGNEEVSIGVPEECWPSGLFGNFFRFQYPITNVAATTNNLYVFTSQATYIISGTNLQTFAAQPILNNIGFPTGNMQRAIDVFSNTVVFMTHDYRIAMLSDGGSPVIMSDQLYTDIVDQVNKGAVFDIKYFSDLDKELIFITGHIQSNPLNSKQWVYDVKKSLKLSMQSGIYMPLKHFWNLPWTYPSTAQMSGRINETSNQRRMVFFNFDNTAITGVFSRIDPTLTTTQDWTTAGNVNFDIDLVYALSQVPPGDHVNQRRVPRITPVIYSISFERTSFSGDDDPSFYWFADDLWTDPISVNVSEDPPRRPQSKSYKTMEFPIFNVAQRVAWELTKIQSGDRFELQTFTITFEPDAGA